MNCCTPPVNAPCQDRFIRIFNSVVDLLVSQQIIFLCVCTKCPIQLYDCRLMHRNSTDPKYIMLLKTTPKMKRGAFKNALLQKGFCQYVHHSKCRNSSEIFCGLVLQLCPINSKTQAQRWKYAACC